MLGIHWVILHQIFMHVTNVIKDSMYCIRKAMALRINYTGIVQMK